MKNVIGIIGLVLIAISIYGFFSIITIDELKQSYRLLIVLCSIFNFFGGKSMLLTAIKWIKEDLDREIE